ncbi:MAG: LysR family transcriptional regulator [Neisseriaceae bacterium]|nr:LysR family transcriptional regulator [Neisseriaceae bacterium]MBP6862108.1 LysR family transcriptional regulator [Neisseriaceae bacterium]
MDTRLPLLPLRTFVAIAREGSIKAAAQSLHVTSGAVSQQLRQLEAHLGQSLFVRTREGMMLTEAGQRIYPVLRQAFAQINSVTELVAATKARQTVAISTVPSFAASWLVPRLNRFHERHPHIEVRVEATPKLVDLKRRQVDIALRHGLGVYPGLKSIRLLAPKMVPVLSPLLLAQHPQIKAPADCLAYPLLQDSDRADWRLWLQAHGVADDARAERGTSFEDDFLLLRAAEAGQGIALVQDVSAAESLASGRVVQAIERPWPARFAYYAVLLPDTALRPEVAQCLAWLTEESQP